MAYRAQRQDLFGNTGAPTPPTTGVDVAGIIDSLSNASTSFIQQAMLRRKAQNDQAIAADQRTYQRSRDTAEDARHDQERADRLTHEDADLKLRQQAERHRFIEAGGVPAHEEMTPTPTTASVGAIAPPAAPLAPNMLERGNVDLNARPRVTNKNGSVSTVRSISIGEDGKEVLIPTVSDDGRIMSNDEAIAAYRQTGRHLGKFKDATSATAYAKQLHASEAGKNPIRDAMLNGLPAPAMTPSAAPQPSATNPLPAFKTTETAVPESYDPRRSGDYVRQTDAAGVRAQVQGDLQAQRLAAQQAGRVFAAGQAKDLARLRSQLAADAKAKSPIGRAMTGNVIEQASQKTAEGLLDQFGGSYDEAYDFLMNTKEGKDLRDFGVSPRHLTAARARWTRDATGQAIKLQTSGFMEPDSAVAAVQNTRRLLGGTGKTSSPTASDTVPALKPPAPPNAAAPKVAAPAPNDTGKASRPVLSSAAKTKAKTEPAFAAFLKSKGYSDKDWK